MRLESFFADCYLPQRLFGKSPETARLMRFSIRAFAKTLGRAATLADLTDDLIRRHMMRLIEDGRAVSTANKDHAHLCALWRHANRLNLVQTCPIVQTLPAPQRTPRAWTADECRQLLDTCQTLRGKVGAVPAAAWWTGLIETCLDTGERIGAISNARWGWLSGEWILVPAEHRKGGKRDRQYRLSPTTLATIRTIRRYSGESQEIWPWPYCRTYLWTRYRAILRKAGLPDDRRSSFHRLRRTTASVCHQAGLDASEMLDHADRRTTRAYLDPRFTPDRQASDVLAQFLENPRPTAPTNRTKLLG